MKIKFICVYVRVIYEDIVINNERTIQEKERERETETLL